jgi:hypothetical protein
MHHLHAFSLISVIFLKKIISGTHRLTQNSVGEGEVLGLLMRGKKFRDAVPACVHLRRNFRNGFPALSITKIPLTLMMEAIRPPKRCLPYTRPQWNTSEYHQRMQIRFSKG